ncbi:AAA-domain-containing protein [Dentipellis sp. KUC8613]|nr:AAA-domain-containing protein [Dentipellis sp. KUC8613]
MQGLWTAHRKKVNLNTPPSGTPPSTTTPPVQTPSNEELPALEASEDATPGASTSAAASERTGTQSTKRKIRSSRGDEGSKRAKLGGAIAKEYTPPTVRLADLGGVEASVEKMLELVAMPLSHPEIYLHTGVQPPRGVLLHGPPGCGKTMLARAMGGELGVPFISISAPSIVSGMSGESEKTLRETFEEAKRVAPCLLFIDEIDAITPKRESAQREMERRIVAQFLTCMDELSWDKTDNKPVIVIGATNRPDSLDAALRRAGRFDHEISMNVPDDAARAQILKVLCSKLRLEGSFDFTALAKATPGYVGADLSALAGAAGIIAVKRIFKQLSDGTLVIPELTEVTPIAPVDDVDVSMQVDPPAATEPTVATAAADASAVAATPDAPAPPAPPKPLPFSHITFPSTTASSIAHFLQAHPSPLTEPQLAPLCITFADFAAALKHVQPSAQREGFATVPDVTWADVGALHATRGELHMAVVQPIRRPELFRRVGIDAPCGVLLWGPPGCGKTLLAKAVANESRANFISVKGPELLNKYVGESERAVRQVFARARASSPCVIFFDELDALVPRRDDSLSESSARVVNTLLTELDGLDARRGVFVLGATNRPDMIDPAMCRPGRLDKLLFVGLPSPAERAEIVRTLVRRVPLAGAGVGADGAAVEALVRERGDGYSGADLAAVVREAGVLALRRTLGTLAEMDQAGAGLLSGGSGDAAEGGVGVNEPSGDDVRVQIADFERALEKVGPSVSRAQMRKYHALVDKFAGNPVGGAARAAAAEKGEEAGAGEAVM